MPSTRAYKRIAKAKRCLINLKSGTAFQGYLIEAPAGIIVIKGATVIEPGSEPVQVSGEIIIEKANIEFIQITEG